eukprot:m.237756 g.237756  ORF g.237756 m.237756 type:complete len:75 (+) comp15277_c1_seq4:1378-1602(+)
MDRLSVFGKHVVPRQPPLNSHQLRGVSCVSTIIMQVTTSSRIQATATWTHHLPLLPLLPLFVVTAPSENGDETL